MSTRNAGFTTSVLSSLALDAAVGDPNHRMHPTVLIGRALTRAYSPWRGSPPVHSLLGGAGALGVVVGASALGARVIERTADRLPAGAILLGLTLKPTFALRELVESGQRVASALERSDIELARTWVGQLVARETAELPAHLLASAAIESLAENLCDSIVAPLLAFSLGGLPAAIAYRVFNTADAMVGYRGELEWLGKSAARSDDLLNIAPARLAAGALIASTLLCEGRSNAALAARRARHEHARLASPNAGWTIAAMAGALGCRLEKPDEYVIGAELAQPTASDVRRAATLVRVAAGIAVALCLGLGAHKRRLPSGEARANRVVDAGSRGNQSSDHAP